MNVERCVDALVVAGLADWVDESGVAWVAQSVGGIDGGADARRAGIFLVREVLQRGLMQVGELSGPGGRFQPWDFPVDAAIALLERTWGEAGDDASIGEYFWLQNTPAGDARGDAVAEE